MGKRNNKIEKIIINGNLRLIFINVYLHSFNNWKSKLSKHTLKLNIFSDLNISK